MRSTPGAETEPVKLLTTKQVAEQLSLDENTLEKWRVDKNNGPPWIYIGRGNRSVRYRQSDVNKWIESRQQHGSGT